MLQVVFAGKRSDAGRVGFSAAPAGGGFDGKGVRHMAFRLRDLKESNEFLNALIENINSGVFIVDGEIRIREFNRALTILFGKENGEVLGELCGNGIGCAFAVKEQSPCGHTSHCSACELRGAILKALKHDEPTLRQKLTREFYIGGTPIPKHFEITTKRILFDSKEMILLIVDDMTESEVQKLELMRRQERIEEDLRAAAEIQRSLLPRNPPRNKGVEVAWRFLPCAFVGGDIFDVFRLDDDLLGFYMLDVSGHGVPAALVTVSLSQTFQSLAGGEMLSPGEVCEFLDREYPFERFGTYVTMVYMVMNVRDGRITYANAGHPPIVVVRGSGELELLPAGGSVIGLGGVLPYPEGEILLRPGDKIITYTDGLLERRGPGGELYGLERFHRRIREVADRPVNAMLSGIVESVMEFGGEERLRDDVSLLGIEFKGIN